jgi:hypothetical protein
VDNECNRRQKETSVLIANLSFIMVMNENAWDSFSFIVCCALLCLLNLFSRTPMGWLEEISFRDKPTIAINCETCHVRSTTPHAIHLQLDISANILEIRAVQSPKCIV